MAKLLKLRRGTTSQHSSFTGAEGEVTIDTDKDTAVVHDGSTAAGRALAREDLNNVASASITGRLASGSIAGAKIANDAIDSQHYAADSIDTEHYAAGSVDGTAIANGSITSAHIAADTVVAADIAANAVGTSEIAADAVTGAQIADDAIDSEHYVNGSIDHHHLANDCIDGDNIQDDVLESEHYGAGSIDHEHLANDIIDGDNIQDDVINSEHIAAGAVDLEHMSSQSVDEDNLHISNSGSNGQYLQKQSGNTGGLTWADVPAGVGGGTGLDLNDSVPLRLGSDNDLSFYHDGSVGRLYNTAGSIVFRSADYYFKDSTGNEDVAKFIADGQCELYHNNSKKLETTSTGIDIPDTLRLSTGYADTGSQLCMGADSSGNCYIAGYNLQIQTGNNDARSSRFQFGHDNFSPTSNNSYDLGTSSIRWRNVYTNDLNLSNEGGANDVDGTWGSYTIQEGNEDLFLLNKRTGKKYKFNLTEVS